MKYVWPFLRFFLLGIPIGLFIGFSDSPVIGVALPGVLGAIWVYYDSRKEVAQKTSTQSPGESTLISSQLGVAAMGFLYGTVVAAIFILMTRDYWLERDLATEVAEWEALINHAPNTEYPDSLRFGRDELKSALALSLFASKYGVAPTGIHRHDSISGINIAQLFSTGSPNYSVTVDRKKGFGGGQSKEPGFYGGFDSTEPKESEGKPQSESKAQLQDLQKLRNEAEMALIINRDSLDAIGATQTLSVLESLIGLSGPISSQVISDFADGANQALQEEQSILTEKGLTNPRDILREIKNLK